jgi:hypothetical protein
MKFIFRSIWRLRRARRMLAASLHTYDQAVLSTLAISNTQWDISLRAYILNDQKDREIGEGNSVSLSVNESDNSFLCAPHRFD